MEDRIITRKQTVYTTKLTSSTNNYNRLNRHTPSWNGVGDVLAQTWLNELCLKTNALFYNHKDHQPKQSGPLRPPHLSFKKTAQFSQKLKRITFPSNGLQDICENFSPTLIREVCETMDPFMCSFLITGIQINC